MCSNWAQWRLAYPDRTVKLLCDKDKVKEMAALPENLRPKAVFVGAIPIGRPNT